MTKPCSHVTALLLSFTLSGVSLFAANDWLAPALSDHMVLQREQPVAVWGWVNARDPVTAINGGLFTSSKYTAADQQ